MAHVNPLPDTCKQQSPKPFGNPIQILPAPRRLFYPLDDLLFRDMACTILRRRCIKMILPDARGNTIVVRSRKNSG